MAKLGVYVRIGPQHYNVFLNGVLIGTVKREQRDRLEWVARSPDGIERSADPVRQDAKSWLVAKYKRDQASK